MPLFLLDILEDPDDREAFEIVYKQYEQLLFYIANNMLHDEGKAEDAVIETFTRLARNFGKTDKKVCPRMKKFVVIIDRNVCIDMIRADHGEIPVEPDSFNDIEGLYVSDDASSHAELNEVVGFICKMPEVYRDALYLLYVEGMTAKDISVLLNVSEATVQKRIQRGRHLLMKEYGNDQ